MALGCLALGPHLPGGVHIFKDVICIRERRPLRAQVTRSGDQAWALWEGFLQSVLPLVSATGAGALRPVWGCSHQTAQGPGPGRPRREVLGAAGRVLRASLQLGVARPGGPSPLSLSCALFPGPRGRREEDLDGVQILHFLLKLPGKTLEAAEGRPVGRGVDGQTRGGAGEAPLAVRIRHRDRRTRGTILSLQGPHGGDTANTLLNNPARALLQTP